MQSRVRFLGKLTRDQTVRHMREATAFISASIYGEPFANTIIEALASGTPLIGAGRDRSRKWCATESTACSTTRQITRRSPSRCGVLDDTPGALAMAVGVRRIGRAFTMDRVLDRTEALFEDAVRSR